MKTTKSTTKQQAEMTPAELINQYGGVSNAIRALAAQGIERGQIAKMLDKRYQHVRNVLITPVKNPKKPVEMSQAFKEALDKGL